jgi:hypothetical protein
MGLAIHNFNDTRKGLVPAVIYSERPTWHTLLYPYMEQPGLYAVMERTNVLTFDGGTLAKWTDYAWFGTVLTEDERNSFASVSMYRCPSSLGSNKIKFQAGQSSSTNTSMYGPLTDYVCLQCRSANNAATYSWGGWWFCFNVEGNTNYGNASGTGRFENFQGAPLRIASIRPSRSSGDGINSGTLDYGNGHKITKWAPRDKISWWADGTSNQLVLAEKHIPAWAVNSTSTAGLAWNGSYLWCGNNPSHANIARFVFYNNGTLDKNLNIFARGPGDPGTSTVDNQLFGDGKYSLGSSHTNIVNFLVGDGSVHSVPTNTNPEIIELLTRVDRAGGQLP